MTRIDCTSEIDGQPDDGADQHEAITAAEGSAEAAASTEKAAAERTADHEQKHSMSIKLKLAVMSRRFGKPLDTDIYYGSKLIARQGQVISGNLVMQLRGFDPAHLIFTNEEVRRLKMK